MGEATPQRCDATHLWWRMCSLSPKSFGDSRELIYIPMATSIRTGPRAPHVGGGSVGLPVVISGIKWSA